MTARGGAAPLNLVWRRDTVGRIVESGFVAAVLLSALDRPVRHIVFGTDAERVFADDMLIVVRHAGPGRADNVEYVAEARRRGLKNVGIFHVGDEKRDIDLSFYADADYVLRNYFFKDAMIPAPGARTRGILWVPNGYANGVGPRDPARHLPMRHRTIVGFFAGQTAIDPTSARAAMLGVVRDNRLPCVIVGTQGFAQGLAPVEYAGHLANSRFALCPAGNAPETIRLYDALEAGCIPIATAAPFLVDPAIMGGAPFPVLKSWADLPAFFADYAAGVARDPDFMEDKRLAVGAWWRDKKSATAAAVARLIGPSP